MSKKPTRNRKSDSSTNVLLMLSGRVDANNRILLDLLETSSGTIFKDVDVLRMRYPRRLLADLKRRKTNSAPNPEDYGIRSLSPFAVDKSSVEYKRNQRRWQVFIEKLDELFARTEDEES